MERVSARKRERDSVNNSQQFSISFLEIILLLEQFSLSFLEIILLLEQFSLSFLEIILLLEQFSLSFLEIILLLRVSLSIFILYRKCH